MKKNLHDVFGLHMVNSETGPPPPKNGTNFSPKKGDQMENNSILKLESVEPIEVARADARNKAITAFVNRLQSPEQKAVANLVDSLREKAVLTAVMIFMMGFMFVAPQISVGQVTFTANFNWPSWSGENCFYIISPTGETLGCFCDPNRCYNGNNGSYVASGVNLGTLSWVCGNYTIRRYERWGDGWNSTGTVTLYANGVLIGTYGNTCTSAGCYQDATFALPTTALGWGALGSTGAAASAPTACGDGTMGMASGQYRDLSLAANTYYNFSMALSGQANAWKADVIAGGAGATSATFNTNQTGWFSGTTAPTLRVYANRSSCTWNSTSSTLTYRNSQPTATASVSPTTICQNGTVNLTGGGNYVGSWSWSGPSGGSFSSTTAQSPTWTSTATGSGTYTVTVSNNGCTATATTASVTRNAYAVDGTLTASTPTTVCLGQPITVTSSGGTGTVRYWVESPAGVGTWNIFQNQASNSSGNGYTYTPTAAGTYRIHARWTNGSCGFCWDNNNGNACPTFPVVDFTVVAQPGAPTSVTKSPNTTGVCGSGIGLSVSSPSGGEPGTGCSFQYRFQRGLTTVQDWSGTASYTTIAADIGSTINVQVRRVNCQAGCTTAESGTLASWTVNAFPVAAISATENFGTTANDGIICSGNSATFTASGGTGYLWSTSATTAGITVSTAGAYQVTVTNTAGCTSTASRTLTVNALPTAGTTVAETSGSANNDGIICNGASATITASGGTSYSWSNGLGTGNLKVVSAAATYTVTVTNANNCSSTATRAITVHANPTASPNFSMNPICSGNSTTLSANATPGSGTITTYAWSSGIAGNSASGSVSTAGTYTVTVTDNNNCSVIATSPSLTVNTNPNPSASATPAVCEGDQISFTVSPGGMTYAWNGPASFTASGQNPTRSNAALNFAGAYGVTVTDGNNCTGTTTTNAVVVNAKPTVAVAYESCPGVNGLTTVRLSSPTGINFRQIPGGFGSGNEFSITNGSNNNFFESRTGSGCVSSTLSFTGTYPTPTQIASTTTTATSCNCSGENRQVYLANGANLVAIVDDQSENLGQVSGTVYVRANPIKIGSEDDHALNRSFVLNSTNTPNAPITITLPVLPAEVNALKTAALTNNAGNYANGGNWTDDINDINDIGATRYNGPNEDNVYNTFGGSVVFINQSSNTSILNGSGISFTTDHLSEWWLHGDIHGAPLPVKLTEFMAKAVNLNIQLDWVTETEINNKGFEIQRSLNGRDFEPIIFIAGKGDQFGNSTQKLRYQFIDSRVIPNIQYYYRLKQIDFDNSYEYSRITNAIINGNNQGVFMWSVGPNPTDGKLDIVFTTSDKTEVMLTITNTIGQIILDKYIVLEPGKNSMDIDLYDNAAGAYFITMIHGYRKETQRIFKQ